MSQRYRVHVRFPDTEADVFETLTETDSDPGEIVAAIQVLYPNYQELWIERLQHVYTEKK